MSATISQLLGNIPQYCVVAEFVGVMLYAFIGGGAGVNAASTGLATTALGNGLSLAVLIYATAGVSGGHLNPAVSTAFVITGRLGRQRYLLYVAAQFLGGIVGAIALKLALPPALLATPFTTSGSMTEAHPIQVFLLEFICTFLLVLTVFATAVDKSGAAKNAAPLAIGLSVCAGVFVEGPYTGGSMNPARTLGAAFAFWDFSHFFVYLFATLAGGAFAGLLYDKVFLEDVQPAEAEDRDEEDLDKTPI